MAETQTSGDSGKKQEKAPEEEKVERQRLIAEAQQFFGVGPHVAAGAFHDYGHGETDLTVSDAQAAIDKFLKRKVKES